MFKVKSTKDLTEGGHKVLLYAHHGFGKTYQCRFYRERYGNGLILSGESGLKSIEDCDIDYVPFTSWDGRHDPDEGVYSFRGLLAMIRSPDFAETGYKWVAVDSLTELAALVHRHVEYEHRDNDNGFALWGDYSRIMLGTLKMLRDLPFHIYVTCLAKESEDDNGKAQYWPAVKGNAVAHEIPAVFDHVFCGVREVHPNADGSPTVIRSMITDEVRGWHGKTRDPKRRLKPIEQVSDVTELLERMRMSDEEFEKLKSSTKEV